MTKKRICVWSGPRNISTALMYAFAQRKDMTVVDEPLYAHYLSKTAAKNYHPGAAEVMETIENDGEKVVDWMKGDFPTECVFFKQMTHHLVHLDWSFLTEMTNIILTRDPVEMLTSYISQVENPNVHDTGYAMHLKLYEFLQERNLPVVVLDGKNVLLNPQKVLTELCEKINIPFDPNMLTWTAGPIKEDGCWAKYWYDNVHKSTEFGAYKPKDVPFPERLLPLLEEVKPMYEALSALAIR